jgi:hypothetical protein
VSAQVLYYRLPELSLCSGWFPMHNFFKVISYPGGLIQGQTKRSIKSVSLWQYRYLAAVADNHYLISLALCYWVGRNALLEANVANHSRLLRLSWLNAEESLFQIS